MSEYRRTGLVAAIEEMDLFEDTIEVPEGYDSTEAANAIDENMSDVLMDFETLDHTAVVLESLANLAIVLERGKEITPKDIDLIKIVRQMAVAGTVTQDTALLPSLENWNNGTIAQEAIGKDIMDSLQAVGAALKNAFNALVDTIQSILVFYTSQGNVIRNLREEVKKMPSGTLSVKVKPTKYLKYGEDKKLVTTASEYVAEYEKMAHDLSLVIDALVDFQENDFFQSVKVFLSPVTGYEEKYQEILGYIEDLFNQVSKISHFKEKKIVGATYYRSDTYLGLSHIAIGKPNTTHKEGFFNTKIDKYAMVFARDEKYEIGSTQKITLDMDKEVALRLLAASERLVKSYRKFTRVSQKLGQLGSLFNLTLMLKNAGQNPEGNLLLLLLKNYRAILKTSGIITLMVGSSFNFSRGNVAKCNELIENFTDQQSVGK